MVVRMWLERAVIALASVGILLYLTLDDAVSANLSKVRVVVSFEAAEVTGPWGGSDQIATTQQQSAAVISQLFEDVFPYWDFDPEGSNQRTRLKLRIMQSLPGRISLRVEAYRGTARKKKWDTRWLDPTDIANGDLSDPAAIPEILHAAVDGLVFEKHEDSMGAWLRSEVPVAVGGRWSNDTSSAQAVLALPYAKFGAVGNSTFKVIGRESQQKPPAALSVYGLSFGLPYGVSNSYKALVVSAEQYVVGGRVHKIEGPRLESARRMKLLQIYIDEVQDSLDPEVLIAPEDRG